jgi:hypothetical protein
MRIAQPISLAGLIALQVVLVFGCTSPVPATVTRAPTTPLQANPTIFLLANKQWPRVAESLRNAGLRLADSQFEADYILTVNVGRIQRNKTCGGFGNVAYILDDRGTHMVVVKGRGFTGSCIPNLLDNMSQKLASYFGS